MKETKVKQTQPKLISALLTMFAVAIALVWGITSLTNEDPLWFIHRFDARAETIIIYWDGRTTTLRPGDPGYDAVMNAFAKAVAEPAGFEWGVAFSEQNIATYRSRSRMLEVKFAEPVQIHSRHPINEAATYLVPLDGTHALWRRVFPFPGVVPYTSGPIDASAANFNSLVQAAQAAAAQSLTAQVPD